MNYLRYYYILNNNKQLVHTYSYIYVVTDVTQLGKNQRERH